MKKRYALSALSLLLLAGAILTYLVMTGERGLGRKAGPVRSIERTMLAADQVRELGWDREKLEQVFDFASTLSTDSLAIVTDGKVVATLGNPAHKYNVHSIRKSLLSALVGQAVGDGPNQIRLSATLARLGIDDTPAPLTGLQKSATVDHLLKSISGINHPAAADGGLTAEKDRLLGHTANQPGTKWAYNNWDYNALTTIFERGTGTTIARAFITRIAGPAGMQDFSADDVSYIHTPEKSRHPAAAFRMSARDLAAFGQIYLDRRLIPSAFIERITSEYSRTGRDDLRWGHSDLWWLPNPDGPLPTGTFWAWGLGNQALFVIPAWSTVIVVQSDTTEFLKRYIPAIADADKPAEKVLEDMILACRKRDARQNPYCIEHRFTTRREFQELVELIVDARR